MKIIIALLLSAPAVSLAYPELIRHGYTNCTACHASPAGGGVLTPYGKSIASEVQSTWAAKGEENFLHGTVDTSRIDEWLLIGGNIRAVQVHQDNDVIRRGKFIKMQAGIELGINQPKWAIAAFAGKFITEDEWVEYSNRYYALYRFTDELALRTGRFLPSFGINMPDHIMSTRGPIGFGYGMERDTTEVSWIGELWNATASYYKSPRDVSTKDQTGYTATLSRSFLNTFKVGAQYLEQKDDVTKVKAYGLNTALGWNQYFYTLAEADQLETRANGTTSKGIYAFQKTGYEFYKGLQALILNDYMQTNSQVGATKSYKYGPGLQWYPRPHFDLQLFWTKQQSQSAKDRDGDYAWFVFHYYL